MRRAKTNTVKPQFRQHTTLENFSLSGCPKTGLALGTQIRELLNKTQHFLIGCLIG